ncbi:MULTISPECIES: DUF2314 domain-containing protein [unclassified Bradyrhizobium]|uniref:YegJ family protein n=1 Tax=unclassified Bradyrhizobium TaxID=2631580 RepID=UPI002896E903|nr:MULTISPECIES: DUF2314 domain-containing protein [unclassified Bradyrhizobium]
MIDFRNGDPEIIAAIAQARSTLPKFWASYDAPKPSETGHSLKARFPYPNNSGEHIWMAEVKKIGNGRYSGRFANAPVHLRGKRAGDLAEFREADISDWMFLRNGKIVGGETIRPMLKKMSKADADALQPGWKPLKRRAGRSGQNRPGGLSARDGPSKEPTLFFPVSAAPEAALPTLHKLQRRPWQTNPKNPRS